MLRKLSIGIVGLLLSCGAASAQIGQGGYTPGSSPSSRFARRTIATGATDTITTADVGVNWNSATSSPKAETIPGCVTALDGTLFWIKDERGTAATNPIVITPASGTIENASTISINSTGGSVQIQCDASTTNWTVN